MLSARSQGTNETKPCERSGQKSTVRFKLTTCKCRELHARGEQPGRRMHASFKYARTRKDGEKEERCIVHIGILLKPILRASPAVCGYNTASFRRHAGSRQLCLLACVVALDRHVRASLLCTWLVACAVL